MVNPELQKAYFVAKKGSKVSKLGPTGKRPPTEV